MTLFQNSCSEIVFSHIHCLHVLRIHAPFKCSSKCIDSIGYLQQLRFLSIYAREIHMTENSLCSLYKLQTLILQSSYINMVPHTLGKLINLRHLMISANKNEPLVLKSYFGSKNLLSFCFDEARNELVASTYHVTSDGLYSSIRWLKPLRNLQRSLELSGLENVVDHEDAKSANLQTKPYVESLTLIWNCGKYDKCARNDKAILEGLQPHTNVKELTIDGYNSSSFPSWFGNPHFSNLTKIWLKRLYNNEECKFLPLSKLPSLTSLEISFNEGIIRMGQEFWCHNAPLDSLENYSIEDYTDCYSYGYMANKNLLEWKERPMVKNGDFSSLKCLDIFKCENLQQISTFPSSLERIYVYFCERLEYITIPYSIGHFSRLQEVKIISCRNLKLVINLNNHLGTLKVLNLKNCCRLKPDLNEDFDHSSGRVSFKEGFAHVIECPEIREWCQWHGFTYEEADRTAHWAMPEDSDLDNSTFTEKYAREQSSYEKSATDDAAFEDLDNSTFKEDLDNSSFTEKSATDDAAFEDLDNNFFTEKFARDQPSFEKSATDDAAFEKSATDDAAFEKSATNDVAIEKFARDQSFFEDSDNSWGDWKFARDQPSVEGLDNSYFLEDSDNSWCDWTRTLWN